MTIHEASRTLLKSSPELWAECSDAASLSRHLGQFGEIKITRLEPETAVAWEGAQVSGTVRLEPSGWGTRVILTAEEAEVPDLPAPAPPVVATEPPDASQTGAEPVLADSAEIEAEPEPSTLAESGPASRPLGVAEVEREETAHDRVAAVVAGPEPAAVPDEEPPAPRKGVFARFFARMRGEVPQQEVAIPAPQAATSVEPQSPSEPPSERRPDPPPRLASVPRLATEPELDAVQPNPAAAAPPATETALKDALESLDSAHHRPFSRS
jgi:hypothetical protein